MPEAGFSLGSNLGDRLRHLRAAVRGLESLRCSGGAFLVSDVYETEPVDCPPDSPAFYNLAVVLETERSPFEILKVTQRLEREQGRPERRTVNAPRPVDIDLLYYDDRELDSPELTLPHPRMHEREFVLRPLAELRPERARECGWEELGRHADTVVNVGSLGG